jgi:hypothetical protein
LTGWKPDVDNLRGRNQADVVTFLQLGSWTCSTLVMLRQPCLAPFASLDFFCGVATMQYSTPPVEKFLRRCWLFMVDLSLRKWSRSIARCLWEAEIWGLHRMIGPGSLVKSLAVDFPFQNHELVGEVIRNHLISVVRNLTFSGNDILEYNWF